MRSFIAAAVLATACTPSTSASSEHFQQFMQQPAAGAVCHSVNGRADHTCTPGLYSHSPEVITDAPRYLHTLCQPPLPKGSTEKRWIEKRRPPSSYTQQLEPGLLAAYGLTDDPKKYVVDHIGSLSLDGDPGHTAYAPSGMPANLYPQLDDGPAGSKVKDREESSLHRQVCSGAMTLQVAQDKLIRDWVS